MSRDAITFGISRTHGGANLVPSCAAFTRALEAVLGRPVRSVMSAGYDELVASIESGAVAMAWLPPLLHAELSRRSVRLVAVPERHRLLAYRSCIFVADDARFSTVDELRGVRAAWIDRSSASGYVAPLVHLMNLGLIPERDLSEQQFLGRSFDVCAAVSDGRADFGACHVQIDSVDRPDSLRSDLLRHYPAARWRLRPLAVTEPIPCDGIVLAQGVPDAGELVQGLLRLAERSDGRAALANLMAADRLVTPPSDLTAAAEKLLLLRDRYLPR